MQLLPRGSFVLQSPSSSTALQQQQHYAAQLAAAANTSNAAALLLQPPNSSSSMQQQPLQTGAHLMIGTLQAPIQQQQQRLSHPYTANTQQLPAADLQALVSAGWESLYM
jgi:hypothetical protein